MATEAILADLPPVRETQGKPKIAVVAHDLRYDGKTNQQLVREMMALGDWRRHLKHLLCCNLALPRSERTDRA